MTNCLASYLHHAELILVPDRVLRHIRVNKRCGPDEIIADLAVRTVLCTKLIILDWGYSMLGLRSLPRIAFILIPRIISISMLML